MSEALEIHKHIQNIRENVKVNETSVETYVSEIIARLFSNSLNIVADMLLKDYCYAFDADDQNLCVSMACNLVVARVFAQIDKDKLVKVITTYLLENIAE